MLSICAFMFLILISNLLLQSTVGFDEYHSFPHLSGVLAPTVQLSSLLKSYDMLVCCSNLTPYSLIVLNVALVVGLAFRPHPGFVMCGS